MGTSYSAVDCYARALRWDPNCFEAHREIGLLHRELGDRDKAGESLRKYLEQAGDAPDVPLIKSYLGFGGIQLCSRVAGKDFIDVPAHELLVDPARNVRSVEIACQELLNKTE